MNKKTNKKSPIESYLSQLPQIQDKRDKDEVYQSFLRSFQTQKNKHSYRKKRWLPLVATMSSIVLVVFLIQSLPLTKFQDSSTEDMVQTEMRNDRTEAELFQSDENQVELIEDEEIAQIRELEDFNYLLTDFIDHTRASYVTIPLVTYQAQTILPVHIPSNQQKLNSLSELMKEVEQYVSLEDNQLAVSPIYSFEFNEDTVNKQTIIQIPDTYEWLDSSTSRYLLEHSLHYLYQGTDIERVVFEKNHPIAEQYKNGILPIRDLHHYPVKIYQAGTSAFILPVIHEPVSSFKDALEEMKIDEEEFYIYHTIPKDAQIELGEKNNQHIYVTISSPSIGHNQHTVSMVEAIIVTANLFGYQEITIDIGLDFLGKYRLSEPISTDKVINYLPSE